MLVEEFRGYIIKACPVETKNRRWSVSTVIEKMSGDKKISRHFHAEDNIYYILEIEAAKECINLGRNLIKANLIGF